jgi:transposase InsO family protein
LRRLQKPIRQSFSAFRNATNHFNLDTLSLTDRVSLTMPCRTLNIKHRRTRPYTPKTNGKAERFIQTALREWAYARAYQNSKQRARHLPDWLHRYNWHRPHGSLKAKPPISRIGLTEDNLLRLHI